MKRVLERLMDTVVTVDDDDEEEEEAKHSQHHGSVHCSLGTLCDWYSSQTKVRLTRSLRHQRGPITVTMDMFSNYRDPAVAHLEKSAALLAEMVNSNLRL